MEGKKADDPTFYQRRTFAHSFRSRTKNSKQKMDEQMRISHSLFSGEKELRFAFTQIPFWMAGILIDFIFKALFNTRFDIHRYTERGTIQNVCVCCKQHISNNSQKNVRFIAQILLNCPANRARYIIFICWTFIAKNLCKPEKRGKNLLCAQWRTKKSEYSKKIMVLMSPYFGPRVFFFLLGFGTIPFGYFRAFRFKLRRQLIKRGMFFKQWAEKNIYLVRRKGKLQTNIFSEPSSWTKLRNLSTFTTDAKKISLK